jgi:hypothetical protein
MPPRRFQLIPSCHPMPHPTILQDRTRHGLTPLHSTPHGTAFPGLSRPIRPHHTTRQDTTPPDRTGRAAHCATSTNPTNFPTRLHATRLHTTTHLLAPTNPTHFAQPRLPSPPLASPRPATRYDTPLPRRWHRPAALTTPHHTDITPTPRRHHTDTTPTPHRHHTAGWDRTSHSTAFPPIIRLSPRFRTEGPSCRPTPRPHPLPSPPAFSLLRSALSSPCPPVAIAMAPALAPGLTAQGALPQPAADARSTSP